MRVILVALFAALALPVSVFAQEPEPEHSSGFVGTAKHVYEVLFTKPVRLSLEGIAPTSGVVAGVVYKPKSWRTPSVFRIPAARASVSANKYWAVDGSLAFQGVGQREWRVEPYARFRSMKRLQYFGLGNDSVTEARSDYAMLDRRVGVYGYQRPVGWLALGGRVEGLWPRTDSGEDPDLPTVESAFGPAQLPGFNEDTSLVYVGAFANLNYPYVRSERPRRGGDYMLAVGTYRDASQTNHSFTRLELEGQERFPVFGNDRLLTLHARLSSSTSASNQAVPFYLMDTLGGADNLRGFKEDILGGDETTATLRAFESFRFRDRATLLTQIEFRQRVWSQVWLSLFVDAGMVAPRVGDLSFDDMHSGVGIGVNVYRTNALAFRAEVSLRGGDTGRQHFFTTGRGLQF